MYCLAPQGQDRSWLMAHLDAKINHHDQTHAAMMVRERQSGIPLAYILGEKEFYGRNFLVTPAVLIPRPETEDLINLVKDLKLPQAPKFLEIGTGSGCVAITLALEFAQSQVLATDISQQALSVASMNDARHEGRVELVWSDLLEDLVFTSKPEHFDVVVANLPYVNRDWDWLDIAALSHEPSQALYVQGANGLALYRKFLKEINYYRGEGKILVDYVAMEADPCQHPALVQMAKKAGLQYLRTLGYCLLFEDGWRYWSDAHQND